MEFTWLISQITCWSTGEKPFKMNTISIWSLKNRPRIGVSRCRVPAQHQIAIFCTFTISKRQRNIAVINHWNRTRQIIQRTHFVPAPPNPGSLVLGAFAICDSKLAHSAECVSLWFCRCASQCTYWYFIARLHEYAIMTVVCYQMPTEKRKRKRTAKWFITCVWLSNAKRVAAFNSNTILGKHHKLK